MKLDFSPPPPYAPGRLPAFPGWWIALGPGIVWMALAQGSGELIWWPYLMAKYGLGFLCLLVPACLLQYSVTFEIGRYTAMTGESIWRGFVRLNPVFAFFLWILMLISFLWFGAFASAGGTALAELTHWPSGFGAKGQSLFWACLSMLVFAFALLTRKKTYTLIERVMWAVSLSTLFGLAVACLNPEVRPVWGEFAKAVFVWPGKLARPWDPQDADKLLTALTFAGLGGFWTLFYSYWILGNGIGCAKDDPENSSPFLSVIPASAGGRIRPLAEKPGIQSAPDSDLARTGRRWRNFLLVDAGVGIVGNIVTTLMMCLLAYAILFPKGILPSGWTLAVEQSRFFEVTWGQIGRALFLCISAAFLADTWLSTADAVAKVHVEMVRFYFFRGQSCNERAWYRAMICVLTVVTGLTMAAAQPESLIIASALIGFVGTCLYTAALLILIHGPFRRALPAELKPGPVSLVFLSVSVLAYSALACVYLKIKFLP